MARPRSKELRRRHPNGKLVQPTNEQRAGFERQIEEAEMQTVLFQRHRRGNRDQLCESPLGRFFLENTMLRKELREAAVEFASIKRRWRAAKGIPTDIRPGESSGTGNGPSDETVRAWGNKIDLVESSIKQRCPRALGPFTQMVIDERDIRPDQAIAVVFALHAAAIALGVLDPHDAPWGC